MSTQEEIVQEDGASEGALSVEEFCALYSVGRTIAYEDIKARRLRAKKRGNRTLIPRSAAREWLAQLPDVA